MGCGAHRETWLVDPMHNIKGHCPRDCMEDGWLVHVIPKAGNPLTIELPVQRAKPFPRLLPRKVGKDTRTGPYLANVDRTVRILDELIAGDPAIVGPVFLLGSVGNMKISDG